MYKLIPAKWRPGWYEFWYPYSTAPNSRAVLGRRYKALGDLDRAEGIITKLFDRLKVFDAETNKAIFEFLDKTTDISMIPEGNPRRIAKSIEQRTITVGKMLVKRDLISKDTFEKMKGQYVHYMYAKHVLGDKGDYILSSTGKLDGSVLTARDETLTPRQQEVLGIIKDASIAVPVGMGKALSDIKKYDYLKSIVDDKDLTWQPSFVKVGNKRMSIGLLVDEIESLKKRLAQNPESKSYYGGVGEA